jgi:hypothetical protein
MDAEQKKSALQDAFDKIWNWFIKGQNPKCVDGAGDCLYRGAGGMRCAAGVLIADEDYKAEFEGMQVQMIIWQVPSLQPYSGLDTELLVLQEMHDNAPEDHKMFLTDMTDHLTTFAGEYGLKIPA